MVGQPLAPTMVTLQQPLDLNHEPLDY